MNRQSAFSYQCNVCGKCCVNKRIQTNPYEILRLALNCGLSTGEFIRRYLEEKGPYLRVNGDGSCIFLVEKGCVVHNDRPLACRTYPLGRWVSSKGEETFRKLNPHPQTEGVYGSEGTVDEFLKQQGAYPYIEVANRYQELFYRLFDALQNMLSADPSLVPAARESMVFNDGQEKVSFMRWIDLDSIVEDYCKERLITVPVEVEQRIDSHIKAIDEFILLRQMPRGPLS